MCETESTSGGNEGSFTLLARPKRIDGSHVEKVIVIGLEVNFQLESFNSREGSKHKRKIILNVRSHVKQLIIFQSWNESTFFINNK